MYIHDNILVGTNVDLIWSKKNREPLKNLDTIVIHYTAGSSAESSVNYLTDENVKASAHILITRTGKVYQMVDFKTKAWHAGNSFFKGRANVNNFSIGIELENAGLLHEREDRYYSWCKKEIQQEEVIELINPQTSTFSYWQDYPETQLNTLNEVIDLLSLEYNIKYLVGHDEISQGRKIDPGPAFPMKHYRQEFYLD